MEGQSEFSASTGQEWKTIETDVLVVGSEGAGARAAIEADKLGARVILATKGIFGSSGVTLTAPYSCSVAFGHEDPRDNPEVHYRDTVRGGHYLSDQKVARVFAEHGPRRLLELESFGAQFYKHEDGRFMQDLMPGHTYPRAIYYNFSTGLQFKAGLVAEVKRRPSIQVKEYFLVVDLLITDGRTAGALALDLAKGEWVVVKAPAVVIATGGLMEIFYPHSDAACDATGDGIAMALRAGAELMDMEFIQFFPTGMVWPPALIGNIWVGDLRYRLSGRLYNKHGERFMQRYDPKRMELSTRDMVARAMVTEILEGRGSPHGGVWLDVSYLADNIIEAYVDEVFPGWSFRGFDLLAAGVDIRKHAVEVAPVAHFFMGGVRINERCETNVPGLYVGGEAAAGVNGANRIEGNALTETQVFGALSGEMAARYCKSLAVEGVVSDVDADQVRAKMAPFHLPYERSEGMRQLDVRTAMQKLMWEHVGIIRRGDGLERAVRQLDVLKSEKLPNLCLQNKARSYNREWAHLVETVNMLQLAEVMAKSALHRTETRGAHHRLDCLDRDDENWLVNAVVTLDGEAIKITKEPVVIVDIDPAVDKVNEFAAQREVIGSANADQS